MSEPPASPVSSTNQSQTHTASTEVRRDIKRGARLTMPYLIMNALATTVATYGLFANSTAVVIGAMIIAMLLGPIMGIALSLVDGDIVLLRRALWAEAVGAVLVVGIAWFLGSVHRDLSLTPEILSRVRPNLLDLMVALAGGAAGAYATVSPRISVGLVGVAISTALVPPLAVTGICLAWGHFTFAAGSFVLFATNLVAIQVASSIVLYLHGYHELTRGAWRDQAFVRRLIVDGVLLLALFVFLWVQLSSVIREKQHRLEVEQALEIGLRSVPGAVLAETRIIPGKEYDIIVALVRVPNSITPAQTDTLQAMLPLREGYPVQLHIRSQITKETTSEGYLHEIAPLSEPVDSPRGDFVAPWPLSGDEDRGSASPPVEREHDHVENDPDAAKLPSSETPSSTGSKDANPTVPAKDSGETSTE